MGDEGTANERDLEVLLSYLLNKQLKLSEIVLALEISRQTYYDQKERGTLTSCNNLVVVARYFGLNPLDLLVHYGYVNLTDVEEFWTDHLGVHEDSDPPEPTSGRAVTLLRRQVPYYRHLGPAI